MSPSADPAASGAAAAASAGSGSSGSSGAASAGGGGATGDRRFRLVGWVVMGLLLAAALVIGVTDDGGPRTVGDRERDISSTVACPACEGQSVAESDTPAAQGVRTYIDRRIGEGASDDEIRDELATRYGDEVLLTPGRSGLAGLVWVLPVVALVVAFAGLALAFRRWRGRSVVTASSADRALVERTLARSGSAASASASGPDADVEDAP